MVSRYCSPSTRIPPHCKYCIDSRSSRRWHWVAMAVVEYNRLSYISEIQSLYSDLYDNSWDVEASEPNHLLPVLAVSFGLLALGLVLRVLAKWYYPGVKLPKDQKL